MSQLIQMRQRIRAIETIKKITHAMRLISMSLHARLKSKEEPLTLYKNSMNQLFYKIKAQTPAWENQILYPPNNLATKTLVIVVGSNKGLCGNFNSALFKLFEMHHPGMINVQYITIGRKATDYIKEKHHGALVAYYNSITFKSSLEIAADITKKIMHAPHQYSHVIVFSNMLKNFFIQRPRMTQLIPFTSATPTETAASVEYVWEESPEDILNFLAQQCVETSLQHTLFQSLLAEQAARFISMDNSTRNAKNLLDETKLQYNKLRQAKITKELTELTGSF